MTRMPGFLQSRLTRRQILISSVLGVVASTVTPVFARDVVHDEMTLFMSLSRFATGHDSLDSQVGQALFADMRERDPRLIVRLEALETLIRDGGYQNVEEAEPPLRGREGHALLMTLIKAWYAGILSDGTNAKVYAFEKALMYQPARDAVVIPTFAHNGPNYWVAAPPPVETMPVF